jgi:hypothetical protein
MMMSPTALMATVLSPDGGSGPLGDGVDAVAAVAARDDAGSRSRAVLEPSGEQALATTARIRKARSMQIRTGRHRRGNECRAASIHDPSGLSRFLARPKLTDHPARRYWV